MAIEKVHKKVLKNGLTVLVLPRHQIPKVSLQLWYNVGAKDERSSEKGIAHFIEHMIFKGTQKLTESDINVIVHKLSGVCNAFTSQDYTGYLFDMPSQQWQAVVPIMADCMRNCTFKEELLNSELKAVIQELKMYNDDYTSSLVEMMIAQMFADHPYHHPIIGYKHDLWNLKRESLVRFYEHHYIPNNATLVVVGDVEVDEVFKVAEENFNHISANWDYKKEKFHHRQDLASQEAIIYRDIQQPTLLLAWAIPGIQSRLDYQLDVMSWIIGSGKGSRLARILVDELELATEVESFTYDLFDHGIFFIHVEPKDGIQHQEIIDIIQSELKNIVEHGITDAELHRAQKKTQADFISLMENNQKLAYLIGKFYVGLEDENYLTKYGPLLSDDIKHQIITIVKDHLRPSIMYKGKVLPLPASEHDYWLKIQEGSDEEDARVLGSIVRDIDIEEAREANNIVSKPPKKFIYKKPTTLELSNGLKVMYCDNPSVPKIEVIIDFARKHYQDPEELQGLSLFTADVVQEGTLSHTAEELAQLIESYGMELTVFPGHMSLSMLGGDLEKGLEILYELVTQALFAEDDVEKVRVQLLAEIKSFWDNPSQFSTQLMREKLYADHPYHKNVMGTEESIQRITSSDIKGLYKKAYTPNKSRLVVVGNLKDYELPSLIQKYFGHWEGPLAEKCEFPELKPINNHLIDYPINRDQTVLAYGGLSIDRKSPDYDALLLFDQIFGGGVLGTMASRLFVLRERSGLFYTISGSLISGADLQKGVIYIKTIVSNDRLAEADRQIRELIEKGASDVTEEELEQAKNALINSFVDNFATSRQMATTFLFLDKFGFPAHYFDERAHQLQAVTLNDVKVAVGKYLKNESLITLRVGRI